MPNEGIRVHINRTIRQPEKARFLWFFYARGVRAGAGAGTSGMLALDARIVDNLRKIHRCFDGGISQNSKFL